MRLLVCTRYSLSYVQSREVTMLDVSARIRLLKTEEGGRTSFVCSGYRPTLRFGHLYTDGALTFLGRQQVYPGDACEVHLTLTNPDYVREYLVVGACFDIIEGPRKIGDGTLLSIPAMLQEKEVGAQPERG